MTSADVGEADTKGIRIPSVVYARRARDGQHVVHDHLGCDMDDGIEPAKSTKTYACPDEAAAAEVACVSQEIGSALGEVWAETLGLLGMACALVDRYGRPSWASEGYRAALAASVDGSDPASTIAAATRRILNESAVFEVGAEREGTVLVLGDRPVGVFLRPRALDRLGRLLGDPAGLVVLRDGEAETARAEAMTRCFGLTRREAQAALGVMRGETPAAIARRLSVSIHTVRTHLAQAYAKTGTAGRAEMAVKLHRSPIGWMAAERVREAADVSAAREI